MNETPDRQLDIVVDGVVTGRPLATIEGAAGAVGTRAERWENTDGSVFAFVTWEEWPRDGSVWEPAL